FLLDFHLAQPALEPGSEAVAWLGGTPGYMAPEHEAALAAIEARQPIPRRVDGAADIFSLGLLLCECLTGERPQPGDPPARWLRRKNGKVSVGLADLLAGCLAPQAAQRYPSAAALAGDLRRHLAQQPLKYTANRSLSERWGKWRRRRPYALLVFFVGALAISCLAIAITVRQQWRDARHTLDEAQAAEAAAEQRSLLQQLHTIVGQLREVYGADSMDTEDAERLESNARRLWEKRQAIVAAPFAGDPGPSRDVKDDLAVLAILWANLHAGRERQADSRAAAEAMEVLQDAERLTGATVVLCREQARLAELLGDRELAARAAAKAKDLAPASPWEHYVLGRMAFSARDFEGAEGHFLAALEKEPKDLWSNFYHGRAAYELKEYEEAVSAFAVCVALAHRAPWCYYNRGLAYMQLSHPEAARRDFDRALALDPHLAAAALDRGMLSYTQQRYDEAIADLERASSDGADAANVAYGLALVFAAKGDRAAALRQLEELFALQPDHEAAKTLAEHLHAGPDAPPAKTFRAR
ncbi:MAG TPA: tetratricopeptide repeat protein, partial [Pirellulales bacterium]|nr:tetratricopeptide repeat protein [Pirellulales bacterium]